MINVQSVMKTSTKSIKCKFCSQHFVNGEKFYKHIHAEHYKNLVKIARKRITQRKHQQSPSQNKNNQTPKPIRISVIKQRHTTVIKERYTTVLQV